MAAEAASEAIRGPIVADLDSLPVGALWPLAIELAHDLSALMDRIDPMTMVEVHGGKSGHARVNFRETYPNDPRKMLARVADTYKSVAMSIEPDVTDWSHCIWSDGEETCRFFLTGMRPRGARS